MLLISFLLYKGQRKIIYLILVVHFTVVFSDVSVPSDTLKKKSKYFNFQFLKLFAVVYIG